MQKYLSFILSLGLLMLASVVAGMGGSMVADLGIWQAFFQSLIQVASKPIEVFVLVFKRARFFPHAIYDRHFFFQNTDPLLI